MNCCFKAFSQYFLNLFIFFLFLFSFRNGTQLSFQTHEVLLSHCLLICLFFLLFFPMFSSSLFTFPSPICFSEHFFYQGNVVGSNVVQNLVPIESNGAITFGDSNEIVVGYNETQFQTSSSSSNFLIVYEAGVDDAILLYSVNKM